MTQGSIPSHGILGIVKRGTPTHPFRPKLLRVLFPRIIGCKGYREEEPEWLEEVKEFIPLPLCGESSLRVRKTAAEWSGLWHIALLCDGAVVVVGKECITKLHRKVKFSAY